MWPINLVVFSSCLIICLLFARCNYFSPTLRLTCCCICSKYATINCLQRSEREREDERERGRRITGRVRAKSAHMYKCTYTQPHQTNCEWVITHEVQTRAHVSSPVNTLTPTHHTCSRVAYAAAGALTCKRTRRSFKREQRVRKRVLSVGCCCAADAQWN